MCYFSSVFTSVPYRKNFGLHSKSWGPALHMGLARAPEHWYLIAGIYLHHWLIINILHPSVFAGPLCMHNKVRKAPMRAIIKLVTYRLCIPAFLTADEIALIAVRIELRSWVRSPVAWGCHFCSSNTNRINVWQSVSTLGEDILQRLPERTKSQTQREIPHRTMSASNANNNHSDTSRWKRMSRDSSESTDWVKRSRLPLSTALKDNLMENVPRLM